MKLEKHFIKLKKRFMKLEKRFMKLEKRFMKRKSYIGVYMPTRFHILIPKYLMKDF